MGCQWEYSFYAEGDLAAMLTPQWKEVPPEIAVPLNWKLHSGQDFLVCEAWFMGDPGKVPVPRVRWSVKGFYQEVEGKYAILWNQTRGWTLNLRAKYW